MRSLTNSFATLAAVTFDLISVWFAAGAVLPFLLSAIGGVPIEIQITLFIVGSVLLVIFVRKYAQKWLFKNMDTKTNVDANKGKQHKLIEGIDFEQNGAIKINGVVWTAISENNEKIEVGEIVEIVRVEGNKMVVKRVEQKETTILDDKIESLEDNKTEKNDNVEENAESKEEV